MKNKEVREEILEALRQLMEKYPKQRFGQILFNYYLYRCPDVNDPFYLEDEKSLKILKRSIDK